MASTVRIILPSSVGPRTEERAPELVEGCARLEGRPQARSYPRPSFETAAQEGGLLRMRSEGLISTVRCDWFHGIDPLVTIQTRWNNLTCASTPLWIRKTPAATILSTSPPLSRPPGRPSCNSPPNSTTTPPPSTTPPPPN